MSLTIELHDPQGHILKELADRRIPQKSIAITYAFCIVQLGDSANWPAINSAITARWHGKTALMRIKKMAWKCVEEFAYWETQ